MKRSYLYICGFFIVAAIFTILYAVSYTDNSDNTNDKNEAPKPTAQFVQVTKPAHTTWETKYVLETYDARTDSVTTHQDTIPAEFAGMTKKQIEDYLVDYMKDIPLSDTLNGLADYELISFSPQQIVVRKTYLSERAEYRYYLTLQENEVVVFYSDKKTPYEYTGIMQETLSAEEQLQLRFGYYVKTDGELYSILENYSS